MPAELPLTEVPERELGAVLESEARRCATCRWFDYSNGDGICRRHPPAFAGFPRVSGASDWCGDYKLDEGKA